MTIDFHRLKSRAFPAVTRTFDERDCILYALSLGMGSVPIDADMLRFVYEKDLVALPSMYAVLAHPGMWFKDADAGIDWVHVLHGEQRMAIHRPLAAAGTVLCTTRVVAVTDKGRDKGAVVVTERNVRDAHTGERMATMEHVAFCRGDGGYGGPSDPPLPELTPCPAGPPLHLTDIPTRPDAALLYRLCADRNPLHADPSVARAAGFERPILHGLATYAVACRAIVETCCAHDPTRLARFDARFTAAVYPGETLRTQVWSEGPAIRFQCWSLERGTLVLDRGTAAVRGGPIGA